MNIAVWRERLRATVLRERLSALGAGGGAVGLSLFASIVGLCCVGPWTVALLGVSGAVSMARWQPLRPYILATSALLLSWAFWRTYRLKRVCIAEGCEDRKPGLAMHLSLWLSVAFLVLAFFAGDLQSLVDATPPALR